MRDGAARRTSIPVRVPDSAVSVETRDLARRELELSQQASSPLLPEGDADIVWDALAWHRPELFGLDISIFETTPLALALRYTLRATPQLVAPLALTDSERRQLLWLRATLARWTGLPWLPTRHLSFSMEAGALREAYDLVTRGGVALTFDPDFGDTALYSETAVVDHRRRGVLISVLLHEEAHLAAARAAAVGTLGPSTSEAEAVWESAARLVERTAHCLSHGVKPTVADLRADADPVLEDALAGSETASVAELLRAALSAAVAAANAAVQDPGLPISASTSPSSSDGPRSVAFSLDKRGRGDGD